MSRSWVRWAAVALCLTGACSSTDKERTQLAKATLAETCALNSECAEPLVCTFERCHKACERDRDCNSGERCVKGPDGNICQLPAETLCGVGIPCQGTQVCSSPDRECRDSCGTSADCLSDQVCARSAGATLCASTDPTRDTVDGTGNILLMLDPTSDASTGPLLPLGLDGGTSADASSLRSCMPSCGVGYQCVAGECKVCGERDGPCCGDSCGANLTCNAALMRCSCGDPGTACCGGSACNNGVSCVAGQCACGAAAQACCPQPIANACSTGLECAGNKCSCLTTGSGDLVLKTDGSLWSAAGSVKSFDGQPLRVKAFATSQNATSQNADGLHCVVELGGTVSCWGTGTSGQLGNAMLTSSATPVRVVIDAAASAPLTNIVSVGAGTNSACALDNVGGVWCWGNGLAGTLGDGTSTNSSFAVAVLTAPGGARLSGVSALAVGDAHVCVQKTDQTVWCWGNNDRGQLGVGSLQASFAIPSQVAALGNRTVQLSAGTASACARTTDTTVWCWGDNSLGQVGSGAASATEHATVPRQVLRSAGGAPFADVVELRALDGSVCAIKGADRSVWCWGERFGMTPGFPITFVRNGFAVRAKSLGGGLFISAPCCSFPATRGSQPSYIDTEGAFYPANAPSSLTNIPCE
jgi:Regulator of chromosome condensation (RCC1) repeat